MHPLTWHILHSRDADSLARSLGLLGASPRHPAGRCGLRPSVLRHWPDCSCSDITKAVSPEPWARALGSAALAALLVMKERGCCQAARTHAAAPQHRSHTGHRLTFLSACSLTSSTLFTGLVHCWFTTYRCKALPPGAFRRGRSARPEQGENHVVNAARVARADAQQSGQALAPSPGQLAAQQAADGSFTLGPCTSATLLNSTYLRMEGVPASVSWLQLAPTHTAGVLPTVRPALFKISARQRPKRGF